MEYKIGIGISLVLLLIVGLFLWLLLRPTGVGQPTAATMQPQFMQRITVAKLKTRVAALTPIPAGMGAGEIYKQLWRTLARQPEAADLLKKIRNNPNPQNAARYRHWLSLLEKAAGKGLGGKTLRFPATVALPGYVTHRATPLRILTNLAAQTGASEMVDKHYKPAIRAFNALLLLGYRLWHNTVFVRTKTIGLGAMDTAATALEQIYGKKSARSFVKQRVARNLKAAVRAAGTPWMKMAGVVHVLTPDPGDLANIAGHAGNRAWRIEALEYLGVMQWRVTNGGRRKAIEMLLRTYRNSPDPHVAAAARQALHIRSGDLSSL